MRNRILIIGFICLFIFPLLAKEKIVFESTLKDAVFCPLWVGDSNTTRSNSTGWWTLKFENGAVISFWRKMEVLPKNDIWWIGKKYKVTKRGFGKNHFYVKLIEEEEELGIK